MTFEEWFVTSNTLKSIASATESTLRSISNSSISDVTSEYGWFNLRTGLQVTPPYLNPNPLTQDDIDNVVLVEFPSGSIVHSFPPTIVPTTFSPSPISPSPISPGPSPTPTPTVRVPIRGTNRNDTLLGTGKDEELIGLGGNDRITANGGNDLLRGGNGNDILSGGGGNDILQGGRGNNRLTGGAGQDIFILERGAGRNTITDFQDGRDKFGLGNGVQLGNIRAIQQGNTVLLDVGGDLLAIVNGVRLRQITVADFV